MVHKEQAHPIPKFLNMDYELTQGNEIKSGLQINMCTNREGNELFRLYGTACVGALKRVYT